QPADDDSAVEQSDVAVDVMDGDGARGVDTKEISFDGRRGVQPGADTGSKVSRHDVALVGCGSSDDCAGGRTAGVDASAVAVPPGLESVRRDAYEASLEMSVSVAVEKTSPDEAVDRQASNVDVVSEHRDSRGAAATDEGSVELDEDDRVVARR